MTLEFVNPKPLIPAWAVRIALPFLFVFVVGFSAGWNWGIDYTENWYETHYDCEAK